MLTHVKECKMERKNTESEFIGNFIGVLREKATVSRSKYFL